MPPCDRHVPSGWLYKSARFSWISSLKLRYFVLQDTELRYYKHPDDAHPAGIIELKHIHDIEEDSSPMLFGFKLVSETKGHWIPILYAETNEERHLWMTQIKSNLSRLKNCSPRHYLPNFCSLNSHHLHSKDNSVVGDINHNVLDRWLDKLDLYDGSDSNSDYFSNRSISNTTIKSSSHSVSGHSLSAAKHRSNESIDTAEYNDSIYSESSTLVFNDSHPGQQHSTFKKSTVRQQSVLNTAISHDSHSPNLLEKISDLKNSTTCSANNHQSIESERAKYNASTLKYFQYPHINRSISTKFYPELGISLSPPPPRR
ncbi:hypothetical protein BD408DRAFT_413401 [Parasitella parasitica]|nr:hypothetical protein BD408DRAFT_413401 [Parasitella parasitica]